MTKLCTYICISLYLSKCLILVEQSLNSFRNLLFQESLQLQITLRLGNLSQLAVAKRLAAIAMSLTLGSLVLLNRWEFQLLVVSKQLWSTVSSSWKNTVTEKGEKVRVKGN